MIYSRIVNWCIKQVGLTNVVKVDSNDACACKLSALCKPCESALHNPLNNT